MVQLNRLAWKEFEQRTSPIVAALMANMQRAPDERPRVKLACLRMLAALQMDPARRELISGFVDSYLALTIEEEKQFGAGVQRFRPQEREEAMEIVTSWMRQGERKMVLRLLRRRFGELDPSLVTEVEALPGEHVEQLGDDLLDFQSVADLTTWLQAHR